MLNQITQTIPFFFWIGKILSPLSWYWSGKTSDLLDLDVWSWLPETPTGKENIKLCGV